MFQNKNKDEKKIKNNSPKSIRSTNYKRKVFPAEKCENEEPRKAKRRLLRNNKENIQKQKSREGSFSSDNGDEDHYLDEKDMNKNTDTCLVCGEFGQNRE